MRNGNEIPVVLDKHQRHADPDLINKLKAEAPGNSRIPGAGMSRMATTERIESAQEGAG